MTTLARFNDPYASIAIAVYEPLIVRWYSKLGMRWLGKAAVGSTMSLHEPSTVPAGEPIRRPGGSDFVAVSATVASDRAIRTALEAGEHDYVNALTPRLENPLFAAHPSLEITKTAVYAGGRMTVGDSGENVTSRVPAIPLIVGSGAISSGRTREMVEATRGVAEAFSALLSAELAASEQPVPSTKLWELLGQALRTAPGLPDTRWEIQRPGLLPESGDWLELLSPVGMAHFYRQLYFFVSEGVGPIEQALTVAPLETLEVVVETTRHQSHEEVYEYGSEQVSETAVESRNVDEVSDKVASMMQRATSTAISANTSFSAGGGILVWKANVSASIGANTSMSQSSQQSSEMAKRNLKEVTKRAAERITKTYSLRVSEATDVTTTNVTRRLIKNESENPISYGLRRVFSRIRVKTQDLGPQLVWQLDVPDPGRRIARSKFLQFVGASPIAPSAEPPSVRDRPQGGTDTGSTTAAIVYDWNRDPGDPWWCYLTLVILVPPDREITGVRIDSMTDLEHLDEDKDPAPSPRNDAQRDGYLDSEKGTYSIAIAVVPGDAVSVSVNYAYTYKPSQAALDAWNEEYEAAMTKFRGQEAADRAKALEEQFARARDLVTNRSKIRSRPASDLRTEERYAVLARLVSRLFPASPGLAAPTPLEMESFNRYFDVEAMFVYVHPSWWAPRFAGSEAGFTSPDYEITNDSEPARLGASLGWVIQLDGDDRRNEFLNSPSVRACLPIRANRERDALAWLAKHVEGDIGYDPTRGPLNRILESIEEVREEQRTVGGGGPDFVTVETAVISSAPGAPSAPLKPEEVYPVIDEFEVTVPTEGFVYDPLTVSVSG